MRTGIINGIVTAILLAVFIGICIWAYSARRRASFEAASRLPLEEDAADQQHAATRGESTP